MYKATVQRRAFIILELAANGDLFDEVIMSGKPFSDALTRRYFRDLCEAIHYIHKKEICHRDLKPENLALDQNYNLKLIDFNLSGKICEDGKSYNLGSTPDYMAPEMFTSKYVGREVDIFAMGVMLFMLVF